MVVSLRTVHAFVVFPGEVTQEAKARQDQGHEIENRRGEEPRHDAVVLGGEAQFGGHGGIGGNEDEPDDHGTRNGEEGPFGPDVGHQSRFAQHRG